MLQCSMDRIIGKTPSCACCFVALQQNIYSQKIKASEPSNRMSTGLPTGNNTLVGTWPKGRPVKTGTPAGQNSVDFAN
jgi:hypothetical protein